MWGGQQCAALRTKRGVVRGALVAQSTQCSHWQAALHTAKKARAWEYRPLPPAALLQRFNCSVSPAPCYCSAVHGPLLSCLCYHEQGRACPPTCCLLGLVGLNCGQRGQHCLRNLGGCSFCFSQKLRGERSWWWGGGVLRVGGHTALLVISPSRYKLDPARQFLAQPTHS